MMPADQGALDVSLEDEVADGEDTTAAEQLAELEASGRAARTRKTKTKATVKPPASPDDELLAGAEAQAELLVELAAVRVATAGVPVEVLSYSRSPGMELNSTAARALAGVGGKGDLLIIAVEAGNLDTITRLAHLAFRLEPGEQ